MQTVFSHIVQKRFSQVNEDVATDALEFVLNSSEAARSGMMKLLRGIVPELPELQFQTQQTEGNIRPDMWGSAGSHPRVYLENKFWAGLTDNQPVSYIKQLAEYTQPTLLLVVAPDAREHTLWRELTRRIEEAGIQGNPCAAAAGTLHILGTDCGPVLALTSWGALLQILELEVPEHQSTRSDLLQLRALCEAADSDAFAPVSAEEITDQHLPAFILQLSSIVQSSIDLAVNEGVLYIRNTRPLASWDRIGRYARFSHEQGICLWFGIRFDLWKDLGGTPFWITFWPDHIQRAPDEFRQEVEQWGTEQGVFTAFHNKDLVVAIDIPFGEEKPQVTRSIVDRLKELAGVMLPLEAMVRGR